VVYKYWAKNDRANNKPKIVCLLTTDHINEVAPSGKKDKDGESIVKPTCVLDYNRSMGAVDLMDQQLDLLLVIRKSYKWYKKLFFRFLLQSALSSHKLFKRGGSRADFLKFLHDCVTQLVTHSPHLHAAAAAGLDSIARLTGREHFPTKREYDWRGKNRSSKKMCRVCTAHGIKTPKGGQIETTWVCAACSSMPRLCVDKGCFRVYHVNFDYSQ